LINTLGTKLAHLITYLKDLFGKNKKARAIVFSKVSTKSCSLALFGNNFVVTCHLTIFSQFPAYLEEIGDLLENHGIESAFVEGNIFRKNKALQSFKASNSKVKVILLSLEKAASGTNLVEASHVILMGTYFS
jgi:SNF2 family DNA or RNA helicase